MTSRRRVAVTGVGAITPIGLGAEGLWCGLRRERSAIDTVTSFDPSPFRSHVAGEVRDFVPRDHIEAKRLKRMNRYGQFSVAAARMAVSDSHLDLAREDRDRIGTIMGSALGGLSYAEEQLGRFLQGGLSAVDAILPLAV